MINAMQQRNIIGKVLPRTPVFKRMKRLQNKVESMQSYTETSHQDEADKDFCLKHLSDELDEAAKTIDEIIAEWRI
jgi:hypothetical protein